ncbi:hypothetical protein, partial [Proteus mirabilis]
LYIDNQKIIKCVCFNKNNLLHFNHYNFPLNSFIAIFYNESAQLIRVEQQTNHPYRQFGWTDAGVMAWHSDKYGLRSEYRWALSEDNLWRVIENKTSEGESYRLEYDDINLTRTAYWHDGSTSFWQLNHDHQIIHYTDRTGIKTALIWDEFGLPCGCRNALGHTHLSEWDALGRLLSITDGNGNQTHWQYQNERERLITVFWPDNTESRLAYDSLGRLVEEAHLGDRVFTSAPRTILLDYDAAGNLVKRETLTDRYQYQWDSMNRLLVASKQPNQRGLEMGLQANQSPFYLRCTWPHYS